MATTRLKHPAVVLLSALLKGVDIELPDGYVYRATAEGVFIVGTQHPAGEPEKAQEILLSAEHVTLSYFVEQAQRLSFDRVFLYGAQAALRERA